MVAQTGHHHCLTVASCFSQTIHIAPSSKSSTQRKFLGAKVLRSKKPDTILFQILYQCHITLNWIFVAFESYPKTCSWPLGPYNGYSVHLSPVLNATAWKRSTDNSISRDVTNTLLWNKCNHRQIHTCMHLLNIGILKYIFCTACIFSV